MLQIAQIPNLYDYVTKLQSSSLFFLISTPKFRKLATIFKSFETKLRTIASQNRLKHTYLYTSANMWDKKRHLCTCCKKFKTEFKTLFNVLDIFTRLGCITSALENNSVKALNVLDIFTWTSSLKMFLKIVSESIQNP